MVNENEYFLVDTVTCANPECAREIKVPGGLKISKTMKFYCPPEIKNGIIIHKCTPAPPNWKELFKGVKSVMCEDEADQLNQFCDSEHCEIPLFEKEEKKKVEPIVKVQLLEFQKIVNKNPEEINTKPFKIELLNQGC
jgi:hypothetical protein